jgi:hypothetical protein
MEVHTAHDLALGLPFYPIVFRWVSLNIRVLASTFPELIETPIAQPRSGLTRKSSRYEQTWLCKDTALKVVTNRRALLPLYSD